MHGDAAAARDIAHNRVPRHRIATFGKMHHQTGLPFHENAVLRMLLHLLHLERFQRLRRFLQLRRFRLFRFLFVELRQFQNDGFCRDAAVADRRV